MVQNMFQCRHVKTYMVSSLEYVEKVSFLGRRGSHHHGHLVHVSDGNLKGRRDRLPKRGGQILSQIFTYFIQRKRGSILPKGRRANFTKTIMG